MESIRDVYSFVNKMDVSGVEGYHVMKKHVDPLKIKYEKSLEKSRDKVTPRPDVAHKTSFFDDIVKRQKKLPGPCSYQPKEISPKSKVDIIGEVPRRKTIFDELEHETKKKNIPAAGKYDKIDVDPDKAKLKSDMSKAELAGSMDNAMRYSLECPGVGEYNKFHNEDKRAAKWVQQKNKKKASKSVKLPDVGTYQPLPMSYNLFQNDRVNKRRYKSFFNKDERWKENKKKSIGYYNISSDWGVTDKKAKKDILSRLSSPSTGRSIYH